MEILELILNLMREEVVWIFRGLVNLIPIAAKVIVVFLPGWAVLLIGFAVAVGWLRWRSRIARVLLVLGGHLVVFAYWNLIASIFLLAGDHEPLRSAFWSVFGGAALWLTVIAGIRERKRESVDRAVAKVLVRLVSTSKLKKLAKGKE